MQKFELERSRFFSIIAWGTIIGFSVFVFSLALNLREATASLGQNAFSLEMNTVQNVESVDFDTVQ